MRLSVLNRLRRGLPVAVELEPVDGYRRWVRVERPIRDPKHRFYDGDNEDQFAIEITKNPEELDPFRNRRGSRRGFGTLGLRSDDESRRVKNQWYSPLRTLLPGERSHYLVAPWSSCRRLVRGTPQRRLHVEPLRLKKRSGKRLHRPSV